MTKEDRQRWADTYAKLYEEGRAVRFLLHTNGYHCAVGAGILCHALEERLWRACLYPAAQRQCYIDIVNANNDGPQTEWHGKKPEELTVLPSAFAEAHRLIKEFPTTD